MKADSINNVRRPNPTPLLVPGQRTTEPEAVDPQPRLQPAAAIGQLREDEQGQVPPEDRGRRFRRPRQGPRGPHQAGDLEEDVGLGYRGTQQGIHGLPQ